MAEFSLKTISQKMEHLLMERVTDEIEIKSGDIIKLSDEELELEFK